MFNSNQIKNTAQKVKSKGKSALDFVDAINGFQNSSSAVDKVKAIMNLFKGG